MESQGEGLGDKLAALERPRKERRAETSGWKKQATAWGYSERVFSWEGLFAVTGCHEPPITR